MQIVDDRPLIRKEPYDVIVVGGGIAGIAASVAAARAGGRTLLLEKSVVLGGLATAGLISWYEPLCDSAGQKMIGGIAEELIRLSVRYGLGNLPPQWKEGALVTDPPQRFASYFSPAIFAMALDEYLQRNGVSLLLDCMATFPVMREGLCLGVVAEVKEGRAFYEARAVVDATGDAGIFHAAGARTVEGPNYLSYVAHILDRNAVAAYQQTGDMLQLRKWLSAGSDMRGNGQPEGTPPATGTTCEAITRFVLEGRHLLFEKLKAMPTPEREVLSLPFMPQFRTIRRIVGEMDFEAVDRQPCAHPVGSCGDFRPEGRGKHYHLPLEALYSRDFPNLFAAGRIISAPLGDGWEIARVIPTCALTGQAAGVAACMVARSKEGRGMVDYDSLRETLEAQKVLFVPLA